MLSALQWRNKKRTPTSTASSSPTKGTIGQRVADVPFRASRCVALLLSSAPCGSHAGRLEESSQSRIVASVLRVVVAVRKWPMISPAVSHEKASAAEHDTLPRSGHEAKAGAASGRTPKKRRLPPNATRCRAGAGSHRQAQHWGRRRSFHVRASKRERRKLKHRSLHLREEAQANSAQPAFPNRERACAASLVQGLYAQVRGSEGSSFDAYGVNRIVAIYLTAAANLSQEGSGSPIGLSGQLHVAPGAGHEVE
jgi:hypothetical protein